MSKSGLLLFERRVVGLMIGLYCRAHHRAEGLCARCADLDRYAAQRLERCPYGAQKKACKKCPTHCYRPEMRQEIRTVMRYAGPRMLLRYPMVTGCYKIRKIWDC